MPSFIRIQDVADILIMSLLLYTLYSWFRRTRAMQVLLGLGVVTLIYFVTRFLGLYMTSWILQQLGTVLIVLIIVVFQAEIRQALYRFSLLRNFFDTQKESQEYQIRFQEISETVFALAAKRTGAIIVFQREESLVDLMLNGVRLDCEITPQILEAIFADGTPLHDGAALIRDGRIALASCHLPLSINPDLPQYLGTRHRAAMGLAERTDAIVIVISEERGDVSVAVGGELQRMATPGQLLAMLDEQIHPVREPVRTHLPKHFFRNLLPKTAIVLIVTAFWVLITSRQGHIATVAAPVRMHGVPDGLVLVRTIPEEVEVQLKSLSSLAPLPSKIDLAADLDLSGIREGQSVIRIKPSDLTLPSGMALNSINPPSVKVLTERKERKVVPVRVRLRGNPSGFEVVAQPSSVKVEGPAAQVGRVEGVFTEEVDPRRLAKGQEIRVGLLPPFSNVVIPHDESVTVRLLTRKKQLKK